MSIPSTQQLENEDEPFETFFQGWLIRQAEFLQQLFHIQTQFMSGNVDVQAKTLIARVMAHYNQYYEAKSRTVHRNSFLLFSPPWLTTYERTFLWIAGFKPSLMFGIVASSGVVLTPEQAQKMGVVVKDVTMEEQLLSEQLRRAEEELTAPSIIALARMAGKEVNGMIEDVETELDRLILIMEGLVMRGDHLRKMTVLKVVEILDAGQTVRFLAAAGQLQMNIRNWGRQREEM